MGFLLTGGRHFSVMDPTEREAIGALRVFAVSFYAVAGIWMPNALAVCVLLGARGLISPTGLWMATALPAAALYVFGAVAGTVASSRVRRARRAWYDQPWIEDLASKEATAWRAEAPGREDSLRSNLDDTALGRRLRYGALVAGVLAALIAIPVLTLVPTAAVGPDPHGARGSGVRQRARAGGARGGDALVQGARRRRTRRGRRGSTPVRSHVRGLGPCSAA